MTRKTDRKLVDVAGEGTGTLNSDFSVKGRNVTAFLDVSASTGTPTLDVKFQEYDPGSGNYIDIPSAAFTQATGVTSQRITLTTNGRALRCVRTVGGTTPTFDYTVGILEAP